MRVADVFNIYIDEEFGGMIADETGNYNFKTEEEAVEKAKRFKKNPRTHNKKMTAENVAYWKSKNYRIERKIVITEDVAVI